MIKVEFLEAFNFRGAIRGLRNPFKSWAKSDSTFKDGIVIGPNDLGLMRRLFKAGKDHRKYTRQILVSMDITAPDYFFKEFSTYKIGTVENSTSLMHMAHKRPFKLEDFSLEALMSLDRMRAKIHELNELREMYLQTKDKEIWKAMMQLIPMSYNYTRHITLNYEVLYNMYFSRKDHKLSEWREFCRIISNELPYFKEIAEIE